MKSPGFAGGFFRIGKLFAGFLQSADAPHPAVSNRKEREIFLVGYFTVFHKFAL
jgi:hypothetical protein